jgi:GNAT superfamily N-acetyltransferase
MRLQIEPLALHRELIPQLQGLFEAEWPGWYGAGGAGDALQDLEAYARSEGLPFGLVALAEGSLCGITALKERWLDSHTHLFPWVAAGLVRRGLRGRGIGAQLIEAATSHAKTVGFTRLHCATATSDTLLLRGGWKLLQEIVPEGEPLRIYCVDL